MIKTHKPRGYLWTCPSLFQQSKEIRNIQYDGCTPVVTRALYPDSDDELSPEERIAKRRRIERLADDFLNGQPLVISSARPHSASLRGAVEGNERSRTGQKYTLPTVEQLEEDVLEVPAEPTKSLATVKKTSRISRPQQRYGRSSRQIIDHTTTEERATSACKQARQFKTVKVSLEPSTEAVKQAAALRDRRLCRAASEAPLPVARISDTISDSDNVEPASEPGSIARTRSRRDQEQPGTEWLLRRHTKLVELSADASFDELNRSSVDTPTRQSQEPGPVPVTGDRRMNGEAPLSSVDPISGPQVLLTTDDPATGRKSLGSYTEHWGCYDIDANQSADPNCRSLLEHTPEDYHTAPVQATDGEVTAEDSQSRLMRQHGLSSTNRTTWVSTIQAQVGHLPTKADETTTPSETGMRVMVQASAKNAGKATKAKRAKSSGSKEQLAPPRNTRRRSAPSRSQAAPSTEIEEEGVRYETSRTRSRAYKIADGDGTPFMFRKRANKDVTSGLEVLKDIPKKSSMRRAIKSSSSEDDEASGRRDKVDQPATPRLDVSFGTDSSAPKLNLALADEHMNTILPDVPLCAGRSSAMKRAIRQEFKDADADVEITRITDEPASSQVKGFSQARELSLSAVSAQLTGGDDVRAHAQAIDDDLGDALIQAEIGNAVERQPLPTQWPGTQAMLAQAHRDFFDSPLKEPGNGDSTGLGTLGASFALPGSPPPTVHREALLKLSQEPAPLPSTQAIMGAWSPWSTIKKPRSRLSEKTAASPTVSTLGHLRKGDNDFAICSSIDQRRRSNLRISTSATDSPPASSTRISFGVTKPASQEHSQQKGTVRTETPKSILRGSQGRQQGSSMGPAPIDKASMMDTDDGHTLSSSQHAQLLFREDSNVDDTITEMTAQVLCT